MNRKEDAPLILMVDDNPENLQILGKILNQEGYIPAVAQSGFEALEFIENTRPDIILLDIMMPGMDGFETCEKLKRNDATSHIPVIFLTALNRTEDKLRAFKVGGEDYITRPYVQEEVLARVRVVLARLRAEAHLKEALKEKELLLKEIHHRVKNNMQIIYSLLSLQSDSAQEQTARLAFLECRGRVRTMSLVHERLYRSENFAEIDFYEYIVELVGELSRLYYNDCPQARMNIRARDVRIDINRAIPCALIINELISNAIKYAFPDGEKGEILVVLEKDDVHSRYRLEVADNGRGLPPHIDYMNSSTLGMQLVNALTRQLGGTLEVRREHGTRFIITFSDKRGGKLENINTAE